MVVSQGSDGPEGSEALTPPACALPEALPKPPRVPSGSWARGSPCPPKHRLTIPGLLLDVVARRQGQVALRAKKLGIYQNVSWVDLFDRISRIGRGLLALGVKRGDRVAIVGDPSPEWLLCDFAAQCIGAISYGLYPTSSRDEVGVRAAPRRRVGADRRGSGARRQGAADARPASGLAQARRDRRQQHVRLRRSGVDVVE